MPETRVGTYMQFATEKRTASANRTCRKLLRANYGPWQETNHTRV